MHRKILAVCFLPILLLIASVSAIAASERGEMINHPYFTLNGCPLDREWTDEVITEALALTPRMLPRLKNRFGIEKDRLCNGSWDELEAFVRQANNPKHRTDQPDGARAFRSMQQRDETGVVKPDGLLVALAQRAAIAPPPTGKGADLLPKAAGVASTSWTWLGPGNIGGFVPFRRIRPSPMNCSLAVFPAASGVPWMVARHGHR